MKRVPIIGLLGLALAACEQFRNVLVGPTGPTTVITEVRPTPRPTPCDCPPKSIGARPTIAGGALSRSVGN